MERKTAFAPNEYYHIYTRGVEKRKIFLNKDDHLRFSVLLYLANNSENIQLSSYLRDKLGRKGKVKQSDLLELLKFPRKNTLVSLGAYCNMSNHIHLLVREKEEGGISKFMAKLLTSYSMFFNTKYSRSGPLFTRPFRSQHVDDDRYLKYLFAYIHLNPLKIMDPKWKEAGIKDLKKSQEFLKGYKDSSYLDYIGEKRLESNILDLKSFPKYFSNSVDFNHFINDWLDLKEDFNTLPKGSPLAGRQNDSK